jgi:hypothetical protein
MTRIVAITEPPVAVLMTATARKRDGRIHLLMRPLPVFEAPGIPQSEVRLLIGSDVRQVPTTMISSFVSKDPARRKEFEKEYGAVHEQWRDMFFDVLKLSLLLMNGDASPDAVARAGIKSQSLAKRAQRDPLMALGQELNIGTEGIVFAVWWSDQAKKLAPGLFCPDARAALYALILVQMGKPGSMAACKHCGTTFIKSRRIQTHCSESCRAATASAKYRKGKARRNGVTGDVET